MSSPAGVSSAARRSLRHALGPQLGDHRRAAHAAGHEPHVGQAGLQARGAGRAARRARARRPPGRGRRRAGSTSAPGTVATSRSSSAPRRATAPAIGVSPTTSTRGEASIGSRKISSDPPDRHGFCTVTAPSAAGASSSPGRMRSSSASPVSSARSACRRTLCSAHAPPTKPSIVPSPSTIAASPVRTLVGRCARTTVATTNGVRAARRSSARRLRLAPIITSQRTYLQAPAAAVSMHHGRRASATKRSSSRVALTPEGLWSGSGGPAPGHPWSVPARRSSSTRRPSSQSR